MSLESNNGLKMHKIRKVEIIIFVFLAKTTAQDFYEDLDNLSVEERPLPPELGESFVVNKTEMELALEDCMVEFFECSNINRKSLLCAVNDKREKKAFLCYCDMMYENCRHDDKHPWQFLHDGDC